MNTDKVSVYTLAAFFGETVSNIKKRFEGQKNIIMSCVIIVVMLLLSALLRLNCGIAGGIVCGVVLTLTVYSFAADIKKGVAFGDISSSGAAYFSGVFGKGTPAAQRVFIILATTVLPLAAAWLLSRRIVVGVLLGFCILLSSRSAGSLCIRFADGTAGSVAKKNFDRGTARRYMAGFGTGLLIFSALINELTPLTGSDNAETPSLLLKNETVNSNVSSAAGTVGQLHNSIVAFNQNSAKYNVIVETSRYDDQVNLYYRTYALWDSKDVNDLNFQQYAAYSSATAKVVVASADYNYGTRVTNFTILLPWYGVRGMSVGSENNKQLALFAKAVIAGIMPDLSQSELDNVCKKLHVCESDFDDMARLGLRLSESDRTYTAFFGDNNMNSLMAHYSEVSESYKVIYNNAN